MIDNENLRETVVSGLKDYLKIDVIRANQNEKPPAYPFLSYTVTLLESENKGTYGVYEDGIDRKPITQTWSISSLSDKEDESILYASKAREWLERVGKVYLKSKGVIVQSVTAISNRDNVLTVEYEYKNGFDVVFYAMSEVENQAIATEEYITSFAFDRVDVTQENINAIGIENLAKHGIILDENATAKEIMQSISKIVSGDSIVYDLEALIDESGVLE